MVVLGVALGPDGAAAVAVDGEVRAIVRDAQVLRRDASGAPLGAIDAALEVTGLRLRDVQRVAVGWGHVCGPGIRLGAFLDLRRVLAAGGTSARVAVADMLACGTRPSPFPLPGGAGRALAAALSPVDAGGFIPTDAGPSFKPIDAHRQLGVHGLPRLAPDDLASRVARLLQGGGRVAWVRGGCEPTPWTLGRRAVLLGVGVPKGTRQMSSSVEPSWLAASSAVPSSAPRDASVRAFGLHGQFVVRAGFRAREVALGMDDPLRDVVVTMGCEGVLAMPFTPRGEPWPVATPNAAARAFRDDDPSLDALVLGPYLVER